MPRNSSKEPIKERPNPQRDPSWCGIGINAVAAASICKSYDRDRRKPEAAKSRFPLRETEFATD